MRQFPVRNAASGCCKDSKNTLNKTLAESFFTSFYTLL